jgi:hypothetical protein
MTNGRKNRNQKQDRNKFVAVVFGVGVVLVFTFLLWTIAMVVLQALGNDTGDWRIREPDKPFWDK